MASSKVVKNDFCRLCACETKTGVVIYSSEGLHLCLEEKIIQCLRIEVSKDDLLSKRVCCPCQLRLEESHCFSEQVHKAQHTLKLLVQMNRVNKQSSYNKEQHINVKLEDELDIKDELEDLPLDVAIELDSEGESESRKINQCKTFKTTGEAFKNSKSRKGSVERSSKQPSRQTTDWSLPPRGQEESPSSPSFLASSLSTEENERNESLEGEQVKAEEQTDEEEDEIHEESEEMKERIEFSESNLEYGMSKLDDTREENMCEPGSTLNVEEEEDEEETETDKSTKDEWKTHWGIKCNECEEIFPYRSQFDKHYQNSYDKKPIYTCSYCNKTMEKYSTFRSHCYRHVTEGRYRCEFCQKGFSLRSMLQVHVLAKHTAVKPFICEECGKGFVTRPGLNIHLKKHKTSEQQEYPCSECGKILRTRGGLAAHESVHRLGRRFMCDVCGKTFTQKVNLQQHHKAHTGERPFACQRCGKRFAEKSHLNRHHSFHSEKRPFQCTVCMKMYKTERCLKVHAMVHSEARPYVCSYCNKGFLSTTKLKQHYNIHTGERPYACKFCERTFTNYPNWLKHTRRRHKDYVHMPNSTEEKSAQTPVRNQKPSAVQQQQQQQQQQQPQLQPQPQQHPFENATISVQTRLPDTPKLAEACIDPSNASSIGILHQYPHNAHSDCVQALPALETPVCHTDSHQSVHQHVIEETFSLPQVYPDHLMSIHIPHPHSILPL